MKIVMPTQEASFSIEDPSFLEMTTLKMNRFMHEDCHADAGGIFLQGRSLVPRDDNHKLETFLHVDMSCQRRRHPLA